MPIYTKGHMQLNACNIFMQASDVIEDKFNGDH